MTCKKIEEKDLQCEEVIQEPSKEEAMEFETMCLPFGGTLKVPVGSVSKGEIPKDGWYNSFRLIDGCLVEVREEEAPSIVAPPCSPVPEPCGGAGLEKIAISPDRGNLSTNRANGLYTSLSLKGTGSVSVTGDGTPTNPFTISISGQSGGGKPVISLAGSPIEVVDAGSNYVLDLKPTKVQPGVYNGFTIDQYGRVLEVEDQDSDEMGVVGGLGIEVETEGPLNTINLQEIHKQEEDVFAGGKMLTIDETGRVIDIRPSTSPVKPGLYDIRIIESLQIEADGSISKVNTVPFDPKRGKPASKSEMFSGSRSEDTMQFITKEALPITVEFSASLGTTGSYPQLKSGSPTLKINGRTTSYIALSPTQAVATDSRNLGPGTVQIELSYGSTTSSPTFMRVSQEVEYEA